MPEQDTQEAPQSASTTEAQPMDPALWQALERMAMGLPIGGIPELVRRGFVVYEPDGSYWHATRAGLIELGAWLASEEAGS